jgi:aspartate ammonia-lyase
MLFNIFAEEISEIKMRIEKDSLGKVGIPDEALYGIHSVRSYNNFPKSGEKIHPLLIKSFLQVKLAAAETNYKCGLLFKEKYDAIHDAIDELIIETEAFIKGDLDSIYDKIIVDPYQGGAGTSLNMNINEVISNTALEILNKNYGDYSIVNPLDDVNLSQSTNDTFPTALRIAAIYLLRELAEALAGLQNSLQRKEDEFKNVLKLGRTQFQDAVPIMLGQEFGAYTHAIDRARKHLLSIEEQLYSVNLGGTAVGNSVGTTKEYVLNVNSTLKKITKLPIVKSEDLIDSSQNLDVFVEVHGIVRTGAISILKMCNDLRFMSSGPHGGIGEIILPPKQSGSSIMPGKINPVVLENTIQICEYIKSNDLLISNLVSSGNLELNAFIPLIAHTFLKSLSFLRDCVNNLSSNCINDITADVERCKTNLVNSSAIAASLITTFGYETIQDLVKYAHEQKIPFVKALMKSKLLDEKELFNIISKEMGIDIM